MRHSDRGSCEQYSYARRCPAPAGYSAAGLPELRAVIALRYTAQGLATHPDQICVTAGAQQALSLLFAHLVRPRGRVLVEAPSYPGALDLLRSRNARTVGIPLDGTWPIRMLAAELADPLYDLAYLMPGLHNPTGRSMPEGAQEALCRGIDGTTMPVVLDDTLTDLAAPASVGPLATHESIRILRIGSLSKTVWGGLRVSWVRRDRATAHLLARNRSRADLGSPVLEQLAATIILADYDDALLRRRHDLRTATARLTDALSERIPELVPQGSLAGPSHWCLLPHGIRSKRLVTAARRHRLRLLDTAHLSPDASTSSYLRLPVDVQPVRLADAVDRLKRAIEDCQTSPLLTTRYGPRPRGDR